MSEQENENIYPIANWDVGPIEEHKLVVFECYYGAGALKNYLLILSNRV